MMKNALFILIDGLRYDVMADEEAARLLMPNLARLLDRGFVRRVIANGQATQFVMPSLFSLTYPLDYGGYNNGIRERPKSFVELLRGAGYETHSMSTCNHLGITSGYDRGFDSVRIASDHRTTLESRITRTLSYDLTLWKKGERTEAETVELIQRELGMMLDAIEGSIRAFDKSYWPARLRRINVLVASGCAAERELLKREPLTVLEKLVKVPAGVYWRFLGERKAFMLKLLLFRVIEGISWRARKYISTITWFPFFTLGHYPVLIGEIIEPIRTFISKPPSRPWFLYMHTMDVHDCRSISRPLHILERLRYLPRWIRAKLMGKTKRRWLYDTAVMYVDDCLGKVFETLSNTGQLEKTLILVVGDHGYQYAQSPRKKQGVATRTHYEDIEAPLLMSGIDMLPSDNGLIDSMGVTATLLDALDIPLHNSFKGRSAFRVGRVAVISENCGGGNADIDRRDVYFTVTTKSYKMMVVLCSHRLKVEELYNLEKDPWEVCNLVGEERYTEVIQEMLAHLYAERGELLARRGALPKQSLFIIHTEH